MATYHGDTIYYSSTDCGTGTDNTVWYSWTSTSAPTTAWGNWCTTSTTATTECASTSSDAVWIRWHYPNGQVTEWNHEYRPAQVSYEDQKRLAREYQEQQAKMKQEREAAEVKANELLADIIGEEQWNVYKETGRLLVKGRNNDYLLGKDGSAVRIEKDKVVDLCIHLVERNQMPETDNVIALALLAKADDYEFDQRANERRVRKLHPLPMAACM